ncbi:MAG: hypothetical protein HYU39_02715 [Thaumarchaeota archaeon]|nr:hypothetical protein [Nitrososphaerota archaeon]
MTQRVSIGEVYREVKSIKKILAELSEKGILQSLASETITKEEGKEIDRLLGEVKKGKLVPLRRVKRG